MGSCSGVINSITAYIEEGKWRRLGEMSLKIWNALGTAISVFGGLFDTRYKCKARKCISPQQFCELLRCYDK